MDEFFLGSESSLNEGRTASIETKDKRVTVKIVLAPATKTRFGSTWRVELLIAHAGDKTFTRLRYWHLVTRDTAVEKYDELKKRAIAGEFNL